MLTRLMPFLRHWEWGKNRLDRSHHRQQLTNAPRKRRRSPVDSFQYTSPGSNCDGITETYGWPQDASRSAEDTAARCCHIGVTGCITSSGGRQRSLLRGLQRGAATHKTAQLLRRWVCWLCARSGERRTAVEFIHEANIVEICTGGLATAGRKIADKRREEPSSADPVIVETRVGCDTRRLAGQAAPSEKRLRYRNRAKTGDVGCLAASSV
jgi:hypothetical protein